MLFLRQVTRSIHSGQPNYRQVEIDLNQEQVVKVCVQVQDPCPLRSGSPKSVSWLIDLI